MKQVELLHAEVIPQYGKTECLKEFKLDKGTKFSWQVKVKVNDRVEKSPCLYEYCSFFANNEEAIKNIRSNIVQGAILNIKGKEDSFKSTKDEKKYLRNISVESFVSITKSKTEEIPQSNDDNLPF